MEPFECEHVGVAPHATYIHAYIHTYIQTHACVCVCVLSIWKAVAECAAFSSFVFLTSG